MNGAFEFQTLDLNLSFVGLRQSYGIPHNVPTRDFVFLVMRTL